MDSQRVQFFLPDLLSVCLLKGETNSHYTKASAESIAWTNSYNVFSDRKRAYLIRCNMELLASRAYPYADYEQFRTCCDLMNLLYVLDEVSDDQTGVDAHTTGQLSLNVLRDPQTADDSALANMTRDFRARFTRFSGPRCLARFLEHWKNYVEAVGREAELREQDRVLDLQSFILQRRQNSGLSVCFTMIEYVLGVDLPDEVFEDPNFIAAYFAGVDMVCWSNDVYSYNIEQAHGHRGNNVVTVLMQEKQIGLQAACDFVGTYWTELMSRYTSAVVNISSWSPAIDKQVSQYLRGIEHWVRGTLDWSFESQRYFGHEHQKIKATRLVTLRPQGVSHEFVLESDEESDNE